MQRLRCDVIDDIYRTGKVPTASGEMVAASIVIREFADALHGIVRRERPELVLEIGMANGVTTTAIAQGLRDNGHGRVISIDPYQTTHWQSGGLMTLKLAALTGLHELREAVDYVALPELLAEGRRFDLVYIDGLHSLEYVLLDFFYVDKMLNRGGIVGFNDCDWLAVMPTLRFLEHYRDYEPVDVGLPAMYEPSNKLTRTIVGGVNRLAPGKMGRSRLFGPLIGRRREDRYFRKLTDKEPDEGFYRPIAGWQGSPHSLRMARL